MPRGATPSRWCVYQFHHLGIEAGFLSKAPCATQALAAGSWARACHLSILRYLWGMELTREENRKDFELPHGCVACGGPIVVRVTPGDAHAVCLACRALSTLRVVPGEEGVAIVTRPGAIA